jgi:hypothetical protein
MTTTITFQTRADSGPSERPVRCAGCDVQLTEKEFLDGDAIVNGDMLVTAFLGVWECDCGVRTHEATMVVTSNDTLLEGGPFGEQEWYDENDGIREPEFLTGTFFAESARRTWTIERYGIGDYRGAGPATFDVHVLVGRHEDMVWTDSCQAQSGSLSWREMSAWVDEISAQARDFVRDAS